MCVCVLIEHINRVFPKWNGDLVRTGKLMNGGRFKDHVCNMHLAGTAVTSWSLTQEVADSTNPLNVLLLNSISGKLERVKNVLKI